MRSARLSAGASCLAEMEGAGLGVISSVEATDPSSHSIELPVLMG